MDNAGCFLTILHNSNVPYHLHCLLLLFAIRYLKKVKFNLIATKFAAMRYIFIPIPMFTFYLSTTGVAVVEQETFKFVEQTKRCEFVSVNKFVLQIKKGAKSDR